MTGDPESQRVANVLGALGLTLSDLTTGAIAAASGQSATASAAVSALDQFLDGPPIEDLRRVLGLTSSGAVRLVDRLAEDGLVTRGPGPDGRTRSITLTAAGRATAGRIAAARAQVLAALLERLPEEQRPAVGPVVDALMTALVQVKDGGAWTCRLCDLTACRRSEGRCPAATAAAARYAGGS